MVFERRHTRVEVSHNSYNQRLVLSQIEQPLVVLEPGTGFDHHRSSERQPLSNHAQVVWRRAPVEKCLALGRPRYALRPRRIVEMRMCIDDAAWCGCIGLG